jgi:hypothetical protein
MTTQSDQPHGPTRHGPTLATQLTPAASLARIGDVTACAITTITVIGVLLTGLGVLSAEKMASRISTGKRLRAARIGGSARSVVP